MSVDNVDNIFADPIANLKLILRAILYFQIMMEVLKIRFLKV